MLLRPLAGAASKVALSLLGDAQLTQHPGHRTAPSSAAAEGPNLQVLSTQLRGCGGTPAIGCPAPATTLQWSYGGVRDRACLTSHTVWSCRPRISEARLASLKPPGVNANPEDVR